MRRSLLVWAARCAVFVAMAVGSSPLARATVMVEIPLEDMVATADALVRGVVVRTGTRVVVGADGLEPWTHTWIRVDEWMHGQAAQRVIQVREPGGRYEGAEVSVSGTPRYVPGEQVVVFLARDVRPGLPYRTLQMAQGKFRVTFSKERRESIVVRDVDDVSFARWRDGQLSLEPAQNGVVLPTRGATVSSAATTVTLRKFQTRLRELVALRQAGRLAAPASEVLR